MAYVFFHISRSCVEDLLFVQRFGRFLAAAPEHAHSVGIVHDGFEPAETAVQNAGLNLDKLTEAEWSGVADRVYRAIADLNRRIVATLTEEGIPAVRLNASLPGLVEKTGDGLVCNRIEFLTAMMRAGSVPVVSPVISVGDGSVLVHAADVLDALVTSIDAANGETRGVITEFRMSDLADSVKNDTNREKTGIYEKSESLPARCTIRLEQVAETRFWELFS